MPRLAAAEALAFERRCRPLPRRVEALLLLVPRLRVQAWSAPLGERWL
jgi:hypothetical protein